MKILYVDLLYDYGVKSRGLNNIGQLGFKASFEMLGHSVETFYYDDYLQRIDELQSEVVRVADAVQPDFIFFCLFQSQFAVETIKALSKKFKTINWFGDDQWRFENFTKDYAPHFTWCITTDKFSLSRYHEIGQRNVIYSQWAAIDDAAVPLDSQVPIYNYDVSFVGGFHPYRAWFISQLEKNGVQVNIFGNGWPAGPLSNAQMNDVFKTSKINLNLSNSTSFDLRYLLTSVRTFISAIRSPKSSSQIKARNFEIPYYGGFQLSDYVPTIEEYFFLGEELVCYTSPNEAVTWINYYLNNDVEREAIRLKGQKKAQAQHAYSNRMKTIFERLS